MSLVERMKADLLASMKARDAVRVATLRTMIAALDNAGAVPVEARSMPVEGMSPDVPRRELSEDEELEILRGEAAARREALAQYEALGQTERAARLRAELQVLTAYVPE